jgi:hypothetical protein
MGDWSWSGLNRGIGATFRHKGLVGFNDYYYHLQTIIILTTGASMFRTFSALEILLAISLAILATSALAADQPVFELVIKDHRFEPERIVIPANTKVKLLVHNQDATPEEFESYELNREKVIVGNTSATIYVGPLDPGEYPFFGEFNPDTAQGVLVAE